MQDFLKWAFGGLIFFTMVIGEQGDGCLFTGKSYFFYSPAKKGIFILPVGLIAEEAGRGAQNFAPGVMVWA